MPSFFDAIFNPTGNSEQGINNAIADFNQTRETTDPFFSGLTQSGSGANSILAQLLGINGAGQQEAALSNFINSPAFDFNFAQGTRAIDNSGAARGMSQSGSQLKALQQFGQGLQANEFDNRINQLGTVANRGVTGAQGLTNNSNQFGELQFSRGQLQDAGNAALFGNVSNLVSTALTGMSGLPSGTGSGRIQF